jgi:hypothetical protein
MRAGFEEAGRRALEERGSRAIRDNNEKRQRIQ